MTAAELIVADSYTRFPLSPACEAICFREVSLKLLQSGLLAEISSGSLHDVKLLFIDLLIIYQH